MSEILRQTQFNIPRVYSERTVDATVDATAGNVSPVALEGEAGVWRVNYIDGIGVYWIVIRRCCLVQAPDG